jgi:GxxExxY protein
MLDHTKTEAPRGIVPGGPGVDRDALTEAVIGAAIEVHRHLGPGLLESAYEECLVVEFKARGISAERQVLVPLVYKGQRVQTSYRVDLLVEKELVVEVKAVEKLLPVHDAQLLSYLRLMQVRTGLILNFHCPVLREGIRRRAL